MRQLCKGNVAVVKGAILAGCRAFYGYPITPASEIAESAALYMPQGGGTFLQAESEVAAINMVYGAAAAGVRVSSEQDYNEARATLLRPMPQIETKSSGFEKSGRVDGKSKGLDGRWGGRASDQAGARDAEMAYGGYDGLTASEQEHFQALKDQRAKGETLTTAEQKEFETLRDKIGRINFASAGATRKV